MDRFKYDSNTQKVLMVGEFKSGKSKVEVKVSQSNKPNITKWAKLLLQMEQNGTLLKY